MHGIFGNSGARLVVAVVGRVVLAGVRLEELADQLVVPTNFAKRFKRPTTMSITQDKTRQAD